MRKDIFSFVLLFMVTFMSGCGNSDDFSDAGYLIEESANGRGGVTYICVGDSTRAESGHQGQYLFYEVSRTLAKKGVRSKLLASSGQTLQSFSQGAAYPTTSDVIYNIAGEGETTIVDISLGINDRYHSKDTIKSDLKRAILRIRQYRPQTHFILTTPTRLYYDSEDTQKLRYAYHEVASELGIGLNTVVDSLMPSYDATPSSWYQSDGVHLSTQGQHEVAQFILGNML